MSQLSIPFVIGGQRLAKPHNDNFNAVQAWANGNIGEDNLADNAVGTTKVKALAVTTPKLADQAVTGAKTAKRTIGFANLAPQPQNEGLWAWDFGAALNGFNAGNGYKIPLYTVPTGVLDGNAWLEVEAYFRFKAVSGAFASDVGLEVFNATTNTNLAANYCSIQGSAYTAGQPVYPENASVPLSALIPLNSGTGYSIGFRFGGSNVEWSFNVVSGHIHAKLVQRV